MFSGLTNKIGDHIRSIFDMESSGRVLMYSPLVGAVAGLGALFFYFTLIGFQSFALGEGMGYYPPSSGTEEVMHAQALPDSSRWWAVLLIPTVGGLACGWLVYKFAPEAEGHGTDAMVHSFHRNAGKIRARVPFIKTIASIITIGTGGSAGREGPIAQIGAGFGSFLSDRLGLSEQERRLLMLAGAAGGIGAIFHSPLGGALFVAEVLYCSAALEFAAVVPAVITSITAYTVFGIFVKHGLVVELENYGTFRDFHELPLYLIFALLCGLVGYVYVNSFYGLRNLFRKLRIPDMFKPALGGLLLGALACYNPRIMAGGYGWIQQALNDPGKMGLGLLLILCLAKIAATSFTISSGGSGGVFAPSLFIGAMLGGAFAVTCNTIAPGAIAHPETFVLVGMGGFFAGVAKVPLTAIIMVSEMSGSYNLLVPLMLVSVVNVAILSSRWTLYEEQVRSFVDSPAHQGDFIIDVLEQLQVSNVFNPSRRIDSVPEGMTLPEVLRMAASSTNTYFPVKNSNDELVGIFSLRDLRSVLTGNPVGSLVVASDIATSPVLTVTLEDDLHTALRIFTEKNIDDIPVVERDNPQQMIGMLSRKTLIAAYHDRVTELQNGGDTQGNSPS